MRKIPPPSRSLVAGSVFVSVAGNESTKILIIQAYSFPLIRTPAVQLLAQDIAIHAFTPSDGSESAAIKVIHRTSQQQAVNDDTPSQVDNLRHALAQLIASMNPNPDHIPAPDLLLFDKVQINLPQSTHEGEITKISWDFTCNEWKFFIESSKDVVSAWYVSPDLERIDEG